MRRLLRCLYNLVINIIVFISGFIIWRDKKVILVGAWMGERFADNSRNLYESLFCNKAELGLKRVIWVTENEKLQQEMTAAGYDVIKTHSLSGLYWHLRAGVHIVCNMYAKTGKYPGDIWGELSAGAIKIQLWHGVGVKACHYMVQSTAAKSLIQKIKEFVFGKHLLGATVFTPGCWGNRYQIATSEENSRVTEMDYGVPKNRIIQSNYPRLNDKITLFPEEQAVIDELERIKEKKKIVLYCPTFREKKQNDSAYENPIENELFTQFLRENNIVWVEKRHFASSFNFDNEKDDNVYRIGTEFDLNILFRCIDVLVTDYSSAASDCVYRKIPVVSFVPDYDDYLNNERGFVADYNLYYPGDKAKTILELQEAIVKALAPDYFSGSRKIEYDVCRNFLFDNRPNDYEWIYNTLKKAIG